jgi:hypothetical protein
MLWTKQYYYFDLEDWLRAHRSHPLLESARDGVRNTEWFHMLNSDVISMPDKWEYPWYAAWDLAFHTISLALVDFDFAKEQLLMMPRSLYCRGPAEPVDEKLEQFYDRLRSVLRQPVVREGQWQLLECIPAWEGNWTWDCFLAFAWQGCDGERLLVAVN